MKVKNKVARAITEAKKEKSEVRLNFKKQENGRFSSISGLVSELKVSQDGNVCVVVKKGKNNYRTVVLDSVMTVVKDGEVYKR